MLGNNLRQGRSKSGREHNVKSKGNTQRSRGWRQTQRVQAQLTASQGGKRRQEEREAVRRRGPGGRAAGPARVTAGRSAAGVPSPLLIPTDPAPRLITCIAARSSSAEGFETS